VNKVKLGFFSFSEVTGDHGEYVAWHQLDHMPEQFQIPGLSWGQRWVATPPLMQARAAAEGDLRRVQYVTNYLMEDPVDRVLRDFRALARELRGKGRFPTTSTTHIAAGFQLIGTYVAPRVHIAADVVPYRPNTGIYALLEQRQDGGALDAWLQRVHQHDMPALVSIDGVVGAWCYAMTHPRGEAEAAYADHRVTIIYLDGDPLTVAKSLQPWLDARWAGAPVTPLLAGPFESFVTGGDWGRFSR